MHEKMSMQQKFNGDVCEQESTAVVAKLSLDENTLCDNLKELHLNGEDDNKYMPIGDAKFQELLNGDEYAVEVTIGQRRIYNKTLYRVFESRYDPFQLFCGRIPDDVLEHELFSLFKPYGTLTEIRLMISPVNQTSRGFAFVSYVDEASINAALAAMNNFEIRPGKHLKLNKYIPNKSLYIGNIPKSKEVSELREEFEKHFSGITDLITYRPLGNRWAQNRGFCFVNFRSHELARVAKRRIERGQVNLWGCSLFVDWADPQDEPTASIMSEVRVLYVRNLVPSVTEDRLKELFGHFGTVERVKRIKDFAFVHFAQRSDALNAMASLQGIDIDGEQVEIVLSRPPADKRKKEEMLRARENRMFRY